MEFSVSFGCPGATKRNRNHASLFSEISTLLFADFETLLFSGYNQNYILTFLYHPKVPPDNNGSEQAIRNIKVKQKVSGLFRSISGAEDFAILRSLTDTVLKSGQNVLAALTLISNA